MPRKPDCHPDRPHRAKGMCGPCHMRAWYLANKQRAGATTRRNHLRKKYGLNEDDYQQLSELQHHRCAVCERKRKLYIDHDHKTGALRGLLCSQCNSALGFFSESVGHLTRAINYLNAGGSW